MTIYFASPGEPLDGDNWTELGMIDADGLQLDESERIIELEIIPQIRSVETKRTWRTEFLPSPEAVNAIFGYDVYALRATVAEWLTRPAPMPSIPKAELIEMQEGINALLSDFQQAALRYALNYDLNPTSIFPNYQTSLAWQKFLNYRRNKA